MTLRRPRTAAQSTALPSLAALIASGVVVDGCDTPAQTAERQRRLTEHGQQAEREFAGNQLGRSATEVGIGLGLIEAPHWGWTSASTLGGVRPAATKR